LDLAVQPSERKESEAISGAAWSSWWILAIAAASPSLLIIISPMPKKSEGTTAAAFQRSTIRSELSLVAARHATAAREQVKPVDTHILASPMCAKRPLMQATLRAAPRTSAAKKA